MVSGFFLKSNGCGGKIHVFQRASESVIHHISDVKVIRALSGGPFSHRTVNNTKAYAQFSNIWKCSFAFPHSNVTAVAFKSSFALKRLVVILYGKLLPADLAKFRSHHISIKSYLCRSFANWRCLKSISSTLQILFNKNKLQCTLMNAYKLIIQ